MLKFTTGRGAVTFQHEDDAMTVAWNLDPSLEGDELLERLRSIVAFMDAQTGREPLPERIPGMALGMAQTAHPAPEPAVGNGWANLAQPAPPELPADRQGDWEMIPPGEQ
jgi:hypothetical protein